MSSAPPAKWFDSLPAPISTPPQMSAKELHELFHTGQSESKVVVVDVRRADIEGDQAALIPNAINLPAQSFHQTLSTLVPILSHSNGRGPRCAAWYQDALNDKGIKSNSYVLTGGIKGWMEQYPDEVVRI